MLTGTVPTQSWVRWYAWPRPAATTSRTRCFFCCTCCPTVLAALAARLPGRADGRLELVVGELTVQIRTFPWQRRTRAYAANLLLDTKAALLKELRPHGASPMAVVLVDPTDPVRVAALLDSPTEANGRDDLDLFDLLTWATRNNVLDPGDVALLVQIEQVRARSGAERRQLAQQWGVTQRTLRRRRQRALTAIRATAGDYLADSA